jgi:thimet oligopeptidase
MISNKKFLLSILIAIVSEINSNQTFKAVSNNSGTNKNHMIKKTDEIASLFCYSAEEINNKLALAKKTIINDIKHIISIPHNKRTFKNTIKALDNLALSESAIFGSAIQILEMASPIESVRLAAHNAIVELQKFWIDQYTNNQQLFMAVESYDKENALRETLSAEQQYFIKELLDEWKRTGVNLPAQIRNQIQDIKKELASLLAQFDKNIASDVSTITVSANDLDGLDKEFVESLEKNPADMYILPMNYPTYHTIMQECKVQETRKLTYKAFVNRAYPKNKQLLEEIIAKRTQLANLLGFSSYAALDLADQMVGSPHQAEQFLTNLKTNVQEKAHREFDLLVANLPPSITLTTQGKLHPWDMPFVLNQYKKSQFNIDERIIAEYFPMNQTIKSLLTIYEKFFGISCVYTSVPDLWHNDTKGIEISDGTGNILGYVLLDMHPRPHKYSHACHVSIIPATYIDNRPNISLSVLITNFTKPTDARPSLLTKNEVVTFFHEFGHALHAVLGRTTIANHAGTKVKTDFVELPSQILEEWLTDKDILKIISCHYKTGDTLPDDIIENMVKIKNLSAATGTLTQLFYAYLSLTYFNKTETIDVHTCMKQVHELFIIDTALDSDNHFYASFGHLTGYGAKYYSYLWSKVFAKDIFFEIKNNGLLNPAMGK